MPLPNAFASVMMSGTIPSPAWLPAKNQSPVRPQPVITSSAFTGGGHFQVAASGLTGVNYTLQMSTNVSSTSWTPLLVTNLVGTTFQFTDTAATNKQSFYRVLIGP